jgi:endo-cleaving rubber dioxygenase
MKREFERRLNVVLIALITLITAGCAGDYSGDADGGDGGPRPGGGSFSGPEDFYAKRVEPRLAFCRTCHVPGGVADVDDGRLLMLGPQPGNDYALLRASWEALGGNDPESRILLMASGRDTRSHSGGTPWPLGSAAYADMAVLLDCFETPEGCLAGAGAGPVAEAAPLLAGPRGGSSWTHYCADRPDAAVLPPDPRTRIVPGVNAGKAVAFNAYWRDCANGVPAPRTCGELRDQAALGARVGLGLGEVGSTTAFAGGSADPGMQLPAESYNALWRIWGLPGRPDNFDRLVAERYGSPLSPVRNPYPLPGEDANAHAGGSGQLPMAFTQLREADGRWTGRIGVKACVLCHNGQLGSEDDGPGLGPQAGGAGSIGDFTVAFYDFAKTGLLDPRHLGALTDFGPVAGLTIATNRGTGAIDFFQLGFVLFSNGDPQQLANARILFSQAIGTIKSPPWWNMAYRPQKFHGAVLPMDASRIDMAAYYDLYAGLSGSAAPLLWVDAHAGPFQVWAETTAPPPWPGGYCSQADGTPAPGDKPWCISRPLAEQGAVLFHAKNMWAPELGNPQPQPEQGNGSCAGCHGVYAPRYAQDPAYLDDPELAGIAAYTVPMSVIRTDPVYAEAMQSLKEPDGSVNDAIASNVFVYCGLGEVAETTTPKLLTPPLWGVWAAAPYFHNGSVPNVAGVLDPARERPRIWRRVSAPARADQAGQVVMGYDTDLQRAYDFDALGWKYEALECGQLGTLPFIDCDPLRPERDPLFEQLLGRLYTEIAIAWNLPRIDMTGMTNPQIEARKIYNTNEYSQGNGGHDFTAVLTAAERRALLEYLKTL